MTATCPLLVTSHLLCGYGPLVCVWCSHDVAVGARNDVHSKRELKSVSQLDPC